MDWLAEAKRRFVGHDIYWMNALAKNLEDRTRGLSVHWAVLCLGRLMDLRYPKRVAQLLPEINAARRAINQPAENEDFDAIAREIWSRPKRDAAQTALSKLYSAIDQYHSGENCIRSSCAVISNMFYDNWPDGTQWHEQSDMMFEITLNIHNDVIERRGLRDT